MITHPLGGIARAVEHIPNINASIPQLIELGLQLVVSFVVEPNIYRPRNNEIAINPFFPNKIAYGSDMSHLETSDFLGSFFAVLV